MIQIPEQSIERQLETLNENLDWHRNHQQKMYRKIERAIVEAPLRHQPTLASHMKRWMAVPLSLLLFVGLSGLIFMNSTHLKAGEDPEATTVQTDERADLTHPSVTPDIQLKLDAAAASGISVSIPTQMPKSAKVLVDVLEHTRKDGLTSVSTMFAPVQTVDERVRSLSVTQEELDNRITRENANRVMENRYGADVERLTIRGNPAFYRNRDSSGGSSLSIVAGQYAYTLNTKKLSREELITIAESMEME